MFSTLNSVLILVDFGFAPTFVRAIAYTRRSETNFQSQTSSETFGPLEAGGLSGLDRNAIIGAMRYIYFRLSVIALLLGGVVGTFSLLRPISMVESPIEGWICWGLVLVATTLNIRLMMFPAYLQGVERIAEFRRWEILSGFLTVSASVLVLLVGGGLLELVLVQSSGTLAGALINRYLAHRGSDRAAWRAAIRLEEDVWSTIWPASWRSGLGVLMTFGTVQSTGIIYAQFASPLEVATYLLSLRVIQTLTTISRVPFYVKLPYFARLYAAGEMLILVGAAKQSMRKSSWLLVLGVSAAGVMGTPILRAIGSETTLVSQQVWWVLSLSNLVMLAGAMHLQLYTTTNKITWHIANGISGGIIIAVMPATFYVFGLVGFPVATLAAFGAFYLPYAYVKARKEFDLHLDSGDFWGWMLPIAGMATVTLTSFLI
jgi:O-antigen/teichoic acid export membrane protein